MKKKKIKFTPIIILLVLICLVFGTLAIFKDEFKKDLIDETNVPNNDKEDVQELSVTFTLAGNVLINSNMWTDTRNNDGSYNYKYVFEDLNNIMKKSNLNLYTQQSIIGGKELGSSYGYDYNSPIDVGNEMLNIGFNMVSLASYHSYDKGMTGINNSLNYWNEKNIVYSGINNSSETKSNNIIEKNGIKIGLLSYTLNTDENILENYAVNIYSEEKVKNDYDNLKKNVDIVIVSIDWSNSINDITEQQEDIVNYLSNLGVNIVVGNNSNSILPIKTVNNTLVCYSLGNLLSGHSSIDSRISAMVDFELKIKRTDDNDEISYNDINVLLTYAYNNYGNEYKVIPFSKIQDELQDYTTYYEKYKKLLIDNNSDINIYSIGA